MVVANVQRNDIVTRPPGTQIPIWYEINLNEAMDR